MDSEKINLADLDGMNDHEALEFARVFLVKFLIKHKFQNKDFYGAFLRSLGALINVELMWQEKYDNNQAAMEYFWPNVN